MKQGKTLLDIAIEQKQSEINNDFLKEWQPFEKLNKKVQNALIRCLSHGKYQFQPTHDPKSKRPFYSFGFTKIDETLGLAYTSTGAYAGLWICNSGYLWADDTHYFVGFAINKTGEVIGIAEDENENSIYIKLS
jgi:hypothetical protein